MNLLRLNDLEHILYGCDMNIWLKSDDLILLYYCNGSLFPSLYSSVYLYGTKKDDEFNHFILMNENFDYKIISKEELLYLFNGRQDEFNKRLEWIVNSKYFEDWDLKEGECDYTNCHKCSKLSECNDLYEEEVDNQIASDEFWEEYALCNPMDC